MSVKRAVIVLAIAASACVCAAGAAPVAGQTLSSGGIEGVVQDSAGRALRETSVTLVDVLRGATRMASTDADGHYRFLLVDPGEYDVIAE